MIHHLSHKGLLLFMNRCIAEVDEAQPRLNALFRLALDLDALVKARRRSANYIDRLGHARQRNVLALIMG